MLCPSLISLAWLPKSCSRQSEHRMFSVRACNHRLHIPAKVVRYALRCRQVLMCRAKPWRPSLDDVDRLARGDAAKTRGTGSRDIPHRLNQEEQKIFAGAKKKGFLAVRGGGFRRERRGSPIANIFRQWCDAKETVCVVIEQGSTGDAGDLLVVDFSTLRLLQPTQAQEACIQMMESHGLKPHIPDGDLLEAVPFSIIPAYATTPQPASLQNGTVEHSQQEPAVQELLHNLQAGESMSSPGPADAVAAAQAVQKQADVVRALKASGMSNQSAEVMEEVTLLKKVKEQLIMAEQESASGSAAAGRSGAHTPASSRFQYDNDDGVDMPSVGSSKARDQPLATPDASSQHHGMQVVADRDAAGSSLVAAAAAVKNDDDEFVFTARPVKKRGSGGTSDMHPIYHVPIWQIPPQPLFFWASDRAVCKDAARTIVEQLQDVIRKM